jgi:hypothetical protein
MWRFKIFERDWHLWQWRTELAPSGFWIKYRGPFMWWGKSERKRHGRQVREAMDTHA